MTKAKPQRRDPRTVPIYSPGEVAALLDLPQATVRSWTLGMRHGRQIKRMFRPVIEAADPQTNRLSFVNLIEVHVLAAIRRRYDVQLSEVRRAVHYLSDVPNPLASEEFRTDGKFLFVERFGQIVNASRQGQIVIRDLIDTHLERVEREGTEAVRLFPFTRSGKSARQLRDAPRLVAIDPRHRFGAPFLVACGVDTETVWERHDAGDSVQRLADEFGASQEEIQEAIRYHRRRREVAA